ncbi:MAG: hypothetical protein H0X38_05710 [Planctomycetes bacterium]|nr:hypothetical protein [Planctomycetota bacterium]
MATVLTITANPLLDHLTEARLELGKVTRVARFTPLAGGKGLNVARVLARHGHRVLAAGFAGGPGGALIADLIAADGVEPCLTATAARTRIGFQASAPQRGTTALLEDGVPISAEECGALLRQVRSLLTGTALVVVGGSVPDASTCSGLYRQILDACATAGVPCWVDAYGPAMDEALAGAHPPLLAKPNRQEYGKGRKWLACRELHLTDGGAEVKVRHPDGRYRVIPPTVVELNPVGSGDCYIAGLAHARLNGAALPDQLRYAAAAGAANAARADVARIGPQDIEPLLDGVELIPLGEQS